MKIEKQVTSLEPSKKLEEAGVKQESVWCWCNHNGSWVIELSETECLESSDGVSAFTVSELLEMLTNEEIVDYIYREKYLHDCLDDTDICNLIDIFRSPDKLAEVLIWAIENKLVEEK